MGFPWATTAKPNRPAPATASLRCARPAPVVVGRRPIPHCPARRLAVGLAQRCLEGEGYSARTRQSAPALRRYRRQIVRTGAFCFFSKWFLLMVSAFTAPGAYKGGFDKVRRNAPGKAAPTLWQGVYNWGQTACATVVAQLQLRYAILRISLAGQPARAAAVVRGAHKRASQGMALDKRNGKARAVARRACHSPRNQLVLPWLRCLCFGFMRQSLGQGCAGIRFTPPKQRVVIS